MRLKVRTTKDGTNYFRLSDFKSIVDTKKVQYYKVELLKNGLSVTFYDVDQNIISPKEQALGKETKRSRVFHEKKNKRTGRKKQALRDGNRKAKKTSQKRTKAGKEKSKRKKRN